MKSERSELSDTLELIFPEQCEAMMGTIAQYFEQRGEQRGMEQGMQQGIQKGEVTVLEILLRERFASVPTQYRNLIKQADADTLLRWCKQILTAKTLDDVFKAH